VTNYLREKLKNESSHINFLLHIHPIWISILQSRKLQSLSLSSGILLLEFFNLLQVLVSFKRVAFGAQRGLLGRDAGRFASCRRFIVVDGDKW